MINLKKLTKYDPIICPEDETIDELLDRYGLVEENFLSLTIQKVARKPKDFALFRISVCIISKYNESEFVTEPTTHILNLSGCNKAEAPPFHTLWEFNEESYPTFTLVAERIIELFGFAPKVVYYFDITEKSNV